MTLSQEIARESLNKKEIIKLLDSAMISAAARRELNKALVPIRLTDRIRLCFSVTKVIGEFGSSISSESERTRVLRAQ